MSIYANTRKVTISREGWEVYSRWYDGSDTTWIAQVYDTHGGKVEARGRTRLGAIRAALQVARRNEWDSE